MADQIQIPQRTPQYVPPIDPTGLVEGYLNRQQQAQQNMGQAAVGLGETVNKLRQQDLQNYLLKQQAKGSAFEQGGPYLYNLLYGNGQQPQQPQTGASVPSNSPTTPAASAQTMPQATDQPAIPETIQASLNHPTLGIHAQKILDLQKQMGQNAQIGAYGAKVNQGLKDQLSAEQALMGQEQFQQGQVRQEDQFNRSQAAEESRFQRGQELHKNTAVATEVSKLSPQQTEVKTLNTMFDNLDKNLHSYYKDPKSFIGSGNLNRVTKGRVGSASGAEAINQGKPLVAALNQVLTHRFNFGESTLLMDSLAPSPNDTPQYAASKMKMIHQLIQSMDEGNKDNIAVVTQAINGQLGQQQ